MKPIFFRFLSLMALLQLFSCSSQNKPQPFVFLPKEVSAFHLKRNVTDTGERWEMQLHRLRWGQGSQPHLWQSAGPLYPQQWLQGNVIYHLLDALYQIKDLGPAPAATAASHGLDRPQLELRFKTVLQNREYPVEFLLGQPYERNGTYFARLNGQDRIIKASLSPLLNHIRLPEDLLEKRLLPDSLQAYSEARWQSLHWDKQGKKTIEKSQHVKRQAGRFGHSHTALRQLFDLQAGRAWKESEFQAYSKNLQLKKSLVIELQSMHEKGKEQRLEFFTYSPLNSKTAVGQRVFAKSIWRPGHYWEVPAMPTL